MRIAITLTACTVILVGCTSAPTKDHAKHDMTMDDMTQSLVGKTGDSFDEAFLRAMIMHHQGAIDMARLAQENAKHEEIRIMADDIIEAQQREIDEMIQWISEWGYLKCTLSGCPLMDAFKQTP